MNLKNLTKRGKLFLILAVIAATIFLASAVLLGISFALSNRSVDLGFDFDGRDVVKMTADDDGVRIAGTQNGDIFAFDEEGNLLWETGVLNGFAVYDIAVNEGKVYAVYADGKVISFTEEAVSAHGTSDEPFTDFTARLLDYTIRSGVSDTNLLFGDGVFYLRASCRDGSDSNYIFKFEGEGEAEQLCKSASSFRLGGMTIANGAFYYARRGELRNENNKALLNLKDEEILALASRGDEIYMLTDRGNFVVYSLAEEEQVYMGGLSATFDSSFVFSTGDNFYAKIKNGGVAFIDTLARKVTLKMNAGNDSNLILWDDAFFMLRDTSDVTNPLVHFYTLSQARSNALFSVLRWVFLALAIVFLAATVVLIFCIKEESRAALKKKTLRALKAIWRDRAIYLALLIPFLLLITFYYIPIVLGFSISFLDYVPGERSIFMGFEYFGQVLRSRTFWSGTGTMMLFLVADILKALIPPFIIAELLITAKLKRFSLWVRILLFLPGILPGVAATLVWQQGIFGDGTNALLNAFIKLFAPTFAGLNWLHGPYAMRVMSVVCFGFPWVGSYLIFFGALGGINTSIFEAAKLDGCSWIRRVFTMDIPLILSQFKYVLITTFIASVQNYGTLYILYPTVAEDALYTPALLMYNEIVAGNYNVASVMGVFLFLFLAVVTVLNFRSQRDQIE